MFEATLAELRGLIPGLRLQRNRLREKIEHAEPGPYRTFLEEEFDEVVCLLKGLLSMAGDPDSPRKVRCRCKSAGLPDP